MKKSKVQSPKFKVRSPKSEVRDGRPKADDRRTTSAERLPAREPESAPPNVIFGVLPVLEALRANARRVEKIVVAEGAGEKRLNEIFDLAKARRIQFQRQPRANLSRLVEPGANHQGVVAYVAAASYTDADELLDEIVRRAETDEKPLAVILDGVEDPRNLGAILRTADCAGAQGVFLPERRAAGLTETVAKTSAGAVEYVKTAKVTNVGNLIDELKRRGVWTIGTSADASTDYTQWDWTQSSAIVLGGEGKGLHRLVAEKCDVLVKIPLHGRIESLNVSVAAGVILYEARRQRTAARRRTPETKHKDQTTKD